MLNSTTPIPIITVTHDTPYCFEKFMESLVTYTKHPYHLYIIDSVSKRSDEIDKILDNYKNYIAGAWRSYTKFNHFYEVIFAQLWAIYKFANTEFFVSTDPDIYFDKTPTDCWLTRSIQILSENPEIAICSVRCKSKETKNEELKTIIKNWYDSWVKYKNYDDVLYSKAHRNFLWHLLTFKTDIFKSLHRDNRFILSDGNTYSMYDIKGYTSVSLDYDIHHFYMEEKLDLYPDYGEYHIQRINAVYNIDYIKYGNSNFKELFINTEVKL